jgi:Spy/CpxP family protein refolding chaperone
VKSKFFASRLALILCSSGLMFSAACVGPAAPDGAGEPEEGTEAVDAPVAGDQAAPQHEGKRGMRMHKGKHMSLIHAALNELELSDAQRSEIEKLQDGLKPGEADRATHEAFHKALAEQVKAGSINAAELSDEIDAIKSKMTSMKAAHTTALNSLHGILSAEQRSQLVDNIQQRQQKWAGKGHDGERAEGRKGDRAEGRKGDRAGKRGHRGGPKGEMGRDGMRGMLRGLDLTEDQRAKLDAARDTMKSERPDRDAMKERFAAMKEKMGAFLTAFKSDTFDAAASMPEAPMADMMTKKMDQKVKMLETVVPILTAEQRAELSERILHARDMKRGPHKQGDRRGPRGVN